MIRVVITDDQALARDGLELIIGTAEDIEVVGKGENGEDALALVEQYNPDIVLMDLKMPIMNGVQATRAIREQHPQTRVLVLTTYDADEWVYDAIRVGASGYLLKDSPRDEILQAVRDTIAGKSVTSEKIAQKLYQFVQHGTPAGPSLDIDLNDREREILSLLANGLSNAEIGARIHLAEGTVRNYITGLFEKLEVSDRTQAAAKAWRYQLVNPDDAP
ncbi:MAG: response regulator transcription factor [Chloroflexota bacterium]